MTAPNILHLFSGVWIVALIVLWLLLCAAAWWSIK